MASPASFLMAADDLALVEKARAGDAESFRALVARYQRKVFAVALGIVKDPDQAWDVAQDTFVRLHQRLAEYRGESAFSSWLFRIATHLAIDVVRKERPSRKDDLEEVDEAVLAEGAEGILATGLGSNPQQAVLRKELLEKMTEAMARLPLSHRTILVLREVEGLSYEEMAERLGVPKGTVMSRLFNARRKMQALLRDYAGLTPRPGRSPGGEDAAP